MFRQCLTVCLVVSCLSASAFAIPKDGTESLDLTKIKMMMNGEGKPDDASKSPFPSFDKVTKDMEATKGLFTLWSYKKGAKDKDTEKTLCQIPTGMLGEKFMLSISFSGGGFFTGFPLEEHVVQWEMLDKKLLLVEPQTQVVVDKKSTVNDVVRRTYPDRIRAAIPIVTKSESGDPVIDLGRMLKSNFADIAWMSRGRFGGMGHGINASLSKWTKKKVFELNVEIGVELAVSRSSPPGSYDKKMVHFSFWRLPKSDYKPRVADDRVGYFLTANQDWAKPVGDRDLFNRYVDRWHLVKRDPKLALCDPKTPIVYYIEKTVPIQYRRAVRDGILEWNKAFEKIGFVDAVQVRQQTDDNEWKDLDPEDMRYSFFRWIVSGSSFAMGPHRANPFTGQIYDADIIFDDSMVRSMEAKAARMLPKDAMALKMDDPAVRQFVEQFPQWKRAQHNWNGLTIGETEDDGTVAEMQRRLTKRGHVGCNYANGMKQQLTVARAMLAGQPQEVTDRFLYDVIKEIVTHEVGHTLGLRHNFKASTIYTLDEIRERRGTDEPTCGSVMDYNPVLFFKDNPTEGHFVTPSIGPYDYWAIEYGYRPADGTYKGKDSAETEEEDGDEDVEKVAEADDSDIPSDSSEGIPQDVLDKLPPEVRKMLEDSGKLAQLAGAKASSDEKPNHKPAGSAFTGPDAAERKMLHAIASRASEPELAYASDEDTTILGPDPRSNRFDMGADAINWAKERMSVVDKRMATILEWGVEDTESWYHLRRAFFGLLFEKARVQNYVGRYVGGQYTSRAHRGDADAPPPFELIDPAKQREALSFLEDNLYSDEFFDFPPELLNHLTVPRWWHRGTRISFQVDFQIHQLIAALQWSNLFNRLFPNTLRRIYDAELKTTADDRFTVAEYLQRIQQACWSDSIDGKRLGQKKWTNAAPYLSSVRRSLQREYLNMMELLVRIPPGAIMSPDLHAMVQYSVRQLSGEIGQALAGGNGKLDFASEAHLVACKSRIDRMLDSELREF